MLKQAFSGQTVDEAYNSLLATLWTKSLLLLFIVDHLLQPGERQHVDVCLLFHRVIKKKNLNKLEYLRLTDGKSPSMIFKFWTASTIRFFLFSKRYVWWDASEDFLDFSGLRPWRRWTELLISALIYSSQTVWAKNSEETIPLDWPSAAKYL